MASNLDAFVTSSFLLLVEMASNLLATTSNLEAFVTSSFLLLVVVASNLLAMASNLEAFVTCSSLLLISSNDLMACSQFQSFLDDWGLVMSLPPKNAFTESVGASD